MISKLSRLVITGVTTLTAVLAMVLGAINSVAADNHFQLGRYTYDGHGSVNTHWIETPTTVIVIDVQRDTTHAGEALDAVKALNKPVRAILVSHGHPDHYVGLEQFLSEWPDAKVYSSAETARVIETDHYGYHDVVRELTPDGAPSTFVVPDTIFEANTALAIDGVDIVTQEMGPGEATSATVFNLPATNDLYTGDLVLNGMHGFFLEDRSAQILAALDLAKAYMATLANPYMTGSVITVDGGLLLT